MSFITGSVGAGQSIGVLGQLEDDDGNALDAWQVGFWDDGAWRSALQLDFKPVAVALSNEESNLWAALGTHGEVLWIENPRRDTPTTRRDQIGDGADFFTALHPFEGGLAAVGTGRISFWSNGSGWKQLGSGIPADDPKVMAGFRALTATDDALYACGWRGEIWRLRGGVWQKADTPTNIILTGATVDSSGDIVLCGRMGTIVRGRDERWAVVDHKQSDEDLWSAATFQGHVYLSSMRAIYELNGDRLLQIDDGTACTSFYHLSANDTIMASVGARSILMHDGASWNELL